MKNNGIYDGLLVVVDGFEYKKGCAWFCFLHSFFVLFWDYEFVAFSVYIYDFYVWIVF